MTDKASQALLSGFASLAIALVAGYALYKIITIKGKPSTPSDYGRNWMAWMALIATSAILPKFIINQNIDAFAMWAVAVIAYGGIAFIAGWLFGKFKKPVHDGAVAIKSNVKEIGKQPGATNGKTPMQKSFLIIAAIMLLIAILPLPYSYYPVLRIVVTGSTAFAAFYFFNKDDSQSGIILALMAILWNPIFPIYLDKSLWIPLDIAAAIYMYIVSKKIN
jgi:hypothetical protein